MLEIQLIGRPQILYQRTTRAVLETNAVLCLLGAILLSPEKVLKRAALAQHLWPAQHLEGALLNLRQLLHRLARLWPEVDQYLDVNRLSVAWRADGHYKLDVETIAALELGPLSPHMLQEYIALQRGPLMEGYELRWLEPKRRQYAQARSLFLPTAIAWTAANDQALLELNLLKLALQYAPNEVSLLPRLGFLCLQQGGEREVQHVHEQWRHRWRDMHGQNPPPELEALFEPPLLSAEGTHRHRHSEVPHPEGSPGKDAQASMSSPSSLLDSELMTMAVVLGQAFTWQDLQGCLGRTDQLLSMLESLIQQGVLIETPGNGLAFCSTTQQQALYQQLSAARRRELHIRQVKNLLNQLQAAPIPVESLLHHLEAMDSPHEAGESALKAIELYRRHGQHAQCIVLTTWVIKHLSAQNDRSLLWNAHLERLTAGIVSLCRTHLQADLEALDALLPDIADPLPARMLLARQRVAATNLLGQPDQIRRACQDLVLLVEVQGTSEEACHANLQLATTLIGLGEQTLAQQAIERAHSFASMVESPEPLIHVQLMAATRLLRQLRLTEARDMLQNLLQRLPAVQDEGVRARLFAAYASALILLGDYKVAIWELKSCLERFRRRQVQYYIGLMDYFLGRAYIESTEYALAWKLLQDQEAEGSMSGDILHRHSLGVLEVLLRGLALDDLEAALAQRALPPPDSLLGLVLRGLKARLYLERGNLIAAQEEVNQGLAYTGTIDFLQGEVELRRMQVKIWLRQGRAQEAERLVRATLALGERPAPQGPWPVWRFRFWRELLNTLILQERSLEAWLLTEEAIIVLQRFPDVYDQQHILLYQRWALGVTQGLEPVVRTHLEAACRHVLAVASRQPDEAARDRYLAAPPQARILASLQNPPTNPLMQAPF